MEKREERIAMKNAMSITGCAEEEENAETRCYMMYVTEKKQTIVHIPTGVHIPKYEQDKVIV